METNKLDFHENDLKCPNFQAKRKPKMTREIIIARIFEHYDGLEIPFPFWQEYTCVCVCVAFPWCTSTFGFPTLETGIKSSTENNKLLITQKVSYVSTGIKTHQ